MRALLLIAIGVAFVVGSATFTHATPNCNQVPYGQKCWRCAGWANLPNYKNIACSFSPSTAGGFACTTKKCGLAVEKNENLQKKAPKSTSNSKTNSTSQQQCSGTFGPTKCACLRLRFCGWKRTMGSGGCRFCPIVHVFGFIIQYIDYFSLVYEYDDHSTDLQYGEAACSLI